MIPQPARLQTFAIWRSTCLLRNRGASKMKKTLMLSIAAAMFAPVLLMADDGDGARGVARLSVINGDVSVKRGDSGDIVSAAINAPLVVQDRVLTGPASRAEVQFDYANAI